MSANKASRQPAAIKANTQIKKLTTDQGNDCKTKRTPSIGHSSNHDTPMKNQPK